MDDLRELMFENARLLRETPPPRGSFKFCRGSTSMNSGSQMRTVMRLFELQADQNMRQAEQNKRQAEHDAAAERQIESLVRAVEAFVRGQRRNGE